MVDYFTGSPINPTNNYLYQGDAIPLDQKDRLLRFFKTYYPVDTQRFNCFNKGNDKQFLFYQIMRLIFTDEELNTIINDNPDQQNFGPAKIAKIYDPKENTEPGLIVRRDIYLLEFPRRIDDLDLEELGRIRGKKVHFSLYFLKFLNLNVPKEIENYQNRGDLPRNLNPNEYPDILYTIYVDLRSVFLLGPDYSKNVPDILLLILKQIKEGFFSPENDDVDDHIIFTADRPKIRNNLPSIITYIKLKLNINDDNVDPEDENNIPDE